MESKNIVTNNLKVTVFDCAKLLTHLVTWLGVLYVRLLKCQCVQ